MASAVDAAAARAPWAAARWRILSLAVVGVVTLVPVWASPLVVTADGPSHTYNAMVSVAVRGHEQPFATYLTMEPGGLRPNQAAASLLTGLGRLLGWEWAERWVITITMVACLGLVGGTLGRGGLAPVVGAAWLAHSWFTWMGFYDFGLSVACYAALVATVTRPPSRSRSLLLGALLLALYLTHLFTFVVGAGLALVVLARQASRREVAWSQLALLLPAALLAVIGVTSLGVGGGVSWGSPRQAVIGLVLGDIVRSFHPLDAIGGVAIMVAAWAAVVLYRREASGLVWCGALLLVASVVAPASVGAGGYIPIRLQLMGVITLFPAMAAALERLDVRWARAAAVAVFLAFVAHARYVVVISRVVNADRVTLDRLLTASGAAEGAWVDTRFIDNYRGLFRVSGYRHLVERIAEARRLIVLDNYEALYGVFGVSWRERPDWLGIRRSQDTVFALELVPGSLGWGPGLFFIHESRVQVVSADPMLELGPTIQSGPFAVTPVRRRA